MEQGKREEFGPFPPPLTAAPSALKQHAAVQVYVLWKKVPKKDCRSAALRLLPTSNFPHPNGGLSSPSPPCTFAHLHTKNKKVKKTFYRWGVIEKYTVNS